MSVLKALFVDDETSILSAFQRVMRKEKFETMVTDSPEEALRLFAQESYAVVVSDQRMPSMEGTRFLEKVREISPDTVRIILTGYADIQAAIEAINIGSVYRFLTKPWNDEDLRVTVRQAVFQFELVSENKRLQALTARQNAELKDLNENLEKKVIERTHQITRLNDELEKSFLGSVRVLAELSEMHSMVIGNHSKRVAALCREVGKGMGLSGKDLFQVEVAATLHDIGKVGIPAEISSKPEISLQRHEREVLQRHVIKGEAIVQMVPHLDDVPRLIRCHHEHFDGSGYPDRLKGENIFLGSRIIAVVDAYDKSLNTRALFETATPRDALQSVQGHCPNWFDPEVVSVLARYVGEGKQAWDDKIEVDIRLKDLREGMILSRDLRTSRGTLLLPKNTKIRQDQLLHILNYQESDPILEGIYVYRGKK